MSVIADSVVRCFRCVVAVVVLIRAEVDNVCVCVCVCLCVCVNAVRTRLVLDKPERGKSSVLHCWGRL